MALLIVQTTCITEHDGLALGGDPALAPQWCLRRHALDVATTQWILSHFFAMLCLFGWLVVCLFLPFDRNLISLVVVVVVVG